MAAQLRPNRLDVTDRFPMLGFTIRTDNPPRVAEVVLATDPALFAKKEGRTSSNFYTSREHGVLTVSRGEAVYVVPPEVLSRFIAADRLWFGLATASPPTGTDWTVDLMPTASSPYISLSGLSDRALRRVRMFPTRVTSAYTRGPSAATEWAGDRAQPGVTPAAPSGAPAPSAPAATTPAPAHADVPYDDGFGPLPPLNTVSQPPATAVPPPAAAAAGLGQARAFEADPDQMGIEEAVLDGEPGAPQSFSLAARPRALTSAEYPGATVMASPAYNDGRRGTAIDRIVIHITGAPQSRWLGSHFTREDANSSAHYMVDQNGAILQFVRERDTAWHARAANRRSIGIEHVAIQRGGATYGSTHYPYTPPTQVELETSARLAASLCRKYGLNPDRNTIIGHREADTATTHTACPDGAWDWDGYMTLVAAAYAAAPATSQGLGFARGFEADPEDMGIEAAPYTDDASAPAAVQSSGLALTAAEYSGTSRVAISPAFTPGRTGTAVDRIVIHITDAPTTSSTVNTFTAANAKASSHYLVGQDGEVVQFVSEADTAWHAKGANRRSVGIEHVAVKQGGATYGSHTFPYQPPTEAQYCASAALVTYLCDKYGLTANRTTIIGHREADTGTSHTSCPDGAWDWDHFMNLVTNRVCAPMPTGQSFSNAMSGDTETIEIKYRAFIPAPVLKGPFLDNYAGDGRSFRYSGGSSRGEMTVLVDMSSGGGISNVRYADRHWDPSHAYSASDTAPVAGKPDWWLSLNAGAVPTGTDTCATSDDTLRAYIGAPGTTRNVLATIENASILTLMMSGNNPLVPGSPAIDGDISVLLRRGTNGLEAKLNGSHDGFPAHEVYVNGHRLLAYDPVAAGKGPLALLPPSDRDVDTAWTAVGASASAQALSDDIPLDPGVGGMSIGPDSLQIGDIIVSTTSAAFSGLIRAGSGAPISHAMLYVGQGGQVIEAIGEGVVMRPLTQALEHSDTAVAFRVPGLTDDQRQQVADSAYQYVGRPFNKWGLVRSGLVHIEERLCNALPGEAAARCHAYRGRIPFGQGSPERLFCSQLVLQSFQDVGKQLTTEPCNASAPGDLVNFAFRDGLMSYVGHLKSDQPGLTLFGVRLFGDLVPARGLGMAGALDAGDWSINWDEVYPVGQPTNVSCWATAAAIIDGWRRSQSVSVDSIATFDNLTTANGLPPTSAARFAQAIGFTVEPNACYTADGFRQILEANGPVWVAAKVPGLHAIVVTGMYRQSGAYYVRITDPWDRVVGLPGSPGSYATTHTTGSQYIMTYDAFAAEFEAAGGTDFAQLLHTGGTQGHTINRGSATGAGYAFGLSGGDGPGNAALGIGTSLTRQSHSKNGRSYDLAQLSGMVTPDNALAAGAGLPATAGARVVLDDWPYIEGPSGRTQAGVAIDWKFQGGAVGDIAIVPSEGQVLDGWSASVRADIARNGSTPERVGLKVTVTTTFSRSGEEDQVAVTEVSLAGDGRTQTRHGADRAPVDPVGPPSSSAAPAPQLQTA